ncbi:MAG: ATP-binding protein [Aquabacterium sp.]
MVTENRQTVRSALSELSDDSLNLRIRQARTAMLMAPIFSISVMSGVFATVVCWLIHPLVDPMVLWPWLAAKWLILVPRVWHAHAFARTKEADTEHGYQVFLWLLAIDGLIWGGVGWWLAPANQPDLGALSLACVVGVAATGSFMLHMDARAAAILQWTVLGPNALHCLMRQDQLGLFGAVILVCLTVILKIETSRAHRRMSEMLRLRFALEVVAKQREEARAKAEQISEAKSRFLATISHEIRTPLGGMLGLARVMKEDVAQHATPERLGLIERSGEHLLTVLNDLLDFSKINAGHVAIEKRPFDLVHLVHEVVALSRISAQDKQLRLECVNQLGDQHQVVGDPVRVRQILHNLIGNAIKFTEAGGVTIRLSRESAGEAIRLQVDDTGVGMDEAELARIFDAFQQAQAGKRHYRGGTGLGLTISRELSRAMGGDLVCTSALGRGSSFVCTLALPVVVPEHLVHDKVAERGGRLLTGRVLVVEDDPINALVAEATLKQFGLDVVVLDDGARALQWLSGQRVDMLLLDCHLPGLDGWGVAAGIRQREAEWGQARLPIIALTATLEPQEREQCLAVGMDGVLNKPFEREALWSVLSDHLRPAAWADQPPLLELADMALSR